MKIDEAEYLPPQTFVEDEYRPTLFIRIGKDTQYGMNFVLYEADLAEVDISNIHLRDIWAHGRVKWDGCADIWLGDVDDGVNADGYWHICHRDDIAYRTKVLEKVYDLAAEKIEKWDRRG